MATTASFKSFPKPCRYGTRENCGNDHCRFQHNQSSPAHGAPESAAPAQPTYAQKAAMNISTSAPCRYGSRERCRNTNCHFRHIPAAPPARITVPTTPASAQAPVTGYGMSAEQAMMQAHVAQAVFKMSQASTNGMDQADGLATYRTWLQRQVDVQKAKIQAMSSEYSIPVPNLDANPYALPPLSQLTARLQRAQNHLQAGTQLPQPTKQQPSAASQFHAARASPWEVIAQFPSAAAQPPEPQFQRALVPAQHAPLRRPYTNAYNQAATMMPPQRGDMAWKTTPCRHYTLNGGWCPWGPRCGFIHDPALEWTPRSGRSTPSSGGPTLGVSASGSRSASTSSRAAHCWGFVQGLCPHAPDACRYAHPALITPYVKYTPCLTYPRCRYPAAPCPLKHPQVDVLPARGHASESEAPALPAAPIYETPAGYFDQPGDWHAPIGLDVFRPAPHVAVHMRRPDAEPAAPAEPRDDAAARVVFSPRAPQEPHRVAGGRRMTVAEPPVLELGVAPRKKELFFKGHARGQSLV
ncbi:hypothetical protein BC834DRAFT_488309 [Gloeopeniophorella convolvens]|nr:hypothetical protein BC834DRAFT_488309 [Gloeopeniophorella convolvens]